MKSDNQEFEQIITAAKAQNAALLPEGVPIDIKKLGDIDLTPAAVFASQNNREAVEFLLAQGASINYAGYGAGLGGHQALAEALIDRGAGIHTVARGAAQGGHQDWAEALIGRGADINSVASGAAVHGDQPWAEALIERGANISRVAYNAAKSGHQALAEALIERGAGIPYVAVGAVQGGHQALAEALIVQGAKINTVARNAAFYGHQAWAEALIVRGANINHVAEGAVAGGHLGNDHLIVRWLSHGTAQIPLVQWIQALCDENRFPYYNKPFPKQLLRQIQKNHALMRAPVLRGMPRDELKFNYYESCLLTDANKQYAGGLFLLRAVLAISASELLSERIIAEDNVSFSTLPNELSLKIWLMLFDLAPQQLMDFGKKLQLATVASRSDAGYAGLFPNSEHPFSQSCLENTATSKAENKVETKAGPAAASGEPKMQNK